MVFEQKQGVLYHPHPSNVSIVAITFFFRNPCVFGSHHSTFSFKHIHIKNPPKRYNRISRIDDHFLKFSLHSFQASNFSIVLVGDIKDTVGLINIKHQGESFGSCDVEKVHAVVARSTFAGETFGSCDVKKVTAVVARSTFRSQNVQNTSASDHFWKFRCRKSARRCGKAHVEVKSAKN